MCSNCREQHLCSANYFQQRLRIDKYEIKTNTGLRETANHFNYKYCDPNNKHVYLNVQIIDLL